MEKEKNEYSSLDGNKQSDSNRTIEIFIENEHHHLQKIKLPSKKKHKNDHRKKKKRKHKEILNDSDSSDDNLSTIKVKQELEMSFKKSKKSKKKKMKKHKNGLNNVNNDCFNIKQEVVSDNEQKMSDESDEDVPLSLLEKDSSTQTKVKKTYAISNSADVSDVEGKVKKLKIKKIKVEKDNTTTNCTECNKCFANNLKYKAHMRKVHSHKPFSCVVCSKAFSRKNDLENHFNIHTGQNPFCCGQCGKLFKSDATLKKHVRIFHADNYKKYACSMCPKVLSSASCLEEHERLHTGENPWSCNLCGKLFARERDLRLHANLHQESWKCDICQRCFITSFKLKEHYRSHTGETPYECDKCDRKFARLADYRYHIGTHLGLKPFACELCGMKFTTSSSMKRHLMNMHQQGPLDFKCHICSKGFHTQTRLNSHVKNHENKKKYTCHICNATRSSQSELQRHLILHSGEFRCDTCNRSCSSAERLAAHVAKHDITGKPYACFVCSLGYMSSQTLNKHLATVHKNEDIPKVAPQHLCTLCGMVFDHKDKLNRHLKDDHVVLAVGEIHSLIEEDQHKLENQEVLKLIEYSNESSFKRILLSKPTENKNENGDTKHLNEATHSSFTVEIHNDSAPVPHTSLTTRMLTKIPSIEVNAEDIEESSNTAICDSDKLPDDIEPNHVRMKPDNLEVLSKTIQSALDDEITKNTVEHSSLHEPNVPLASQNIKIEESGSNNTYYSSSQSDTLKESSVRNVQKKAVQLIENFARKNVESYLHNQGQKTDIKTSPEEQLINIEKSDSNTKHLQSDNNTLFSKTDTEKQQETSTPLHHIQPPLIAHHATTGFPEYPTSNIIQRTLPATSQVYNKHLDPMYKSNETKIEIKPVVHAIQGQNKKDHFISEENIISECNNTNLSGSSSVKSLNHFDDINIKDLSASAVDNKNHKHNPYNHFYSKTSYSDILPSVALHGKSSHMSQNSFRNMVDPYENVNTVQCNPEQTSNPWFLTSKASSENGHELKHSIAKGFPESKQRDTKVNRSDVFQSHLKNYEQYNNQYKAQIDTRKDILLSTHHKDNSYDKKNPYSAHTTDSKNSFDSFTQDKNKSSQLHIAPNDIHNSKQNTRGYQSLHNHLTNEHYMPSALGISRDHLNSVNQLNYYNPHAFATMANSPHLFQNFCELQHKMLSSGTQNYNHSRRQHLLSGMDISSQRMMSDVPHSSPYNQINAQPHLSNMSPLSRHTYNDLSDIGPTAISYQNSAPPNNNDSGQEKDDSSGPYELRVSAN